MAKHSVSSYRAADMLSRFQAGCDICVCVCVRAIASQRKGIPESTTRVCVVAGLRFTGGAETKNPRVIDSSLCLQRGKEFAQGEELQKQTPAELIRVTAFGRGGGENIIPLSICQGIGGDGGRRFEYLHQHVKQRLVLSAQSNLDDCGSKIWPLRFFCRNQRDAIAWGRCVPCAHLWGLNAERRLPANGRTAVSPLSRSF